MWYHFTENGTTFTLFWSLQILPLANQKENETKPGPGIISQNYLFRYFLN